MGIRVYLKSHASCPGRICLRLPVNAWRRKRLLHFMFVIPELGRQRQEDQDFKTNVGKIVSSRPACLHEILVSTTKAEKKQRVRKTQGRWRKNILSEAFPIFPKHLLCTHCGIILHSEDGGVFNILLCCPLFRKMGILSRLNCQLGTA